jgi:hypothetical protein
LVKGAFGWCAENEKIFGPDARATSQNAVNLHFIVLDSKAFLRMKAVNLQTIIDRMTAELTISRLGPVNGRWVRNIQILAKDFSKITHPFCFFLYSSDAIFIAYSIARVRNSKAFQSSL